MPKPSKRYKTRMNCEREATNLGGSDVPQASNGDRTHPSPVSVPVGGSSYGTAQPGDRQRAQLFAFLQDSSSPIGVSGCGRLSPAVCGECARKLLWERAFSLVSALSPMVCKSIA